MSLKSYTLSKLPWKHQVLGTSSGVYVVVAPIRNVSLLYIPKYPPGPTGTLNIMPAGEPSSPIAVATPAYLYPVPDESTRHFPGVRVTGVM